MAKSTQSLKIQPRKAMTSDSEELKLRLNELIDQFVFQSGAISIESNFNGFVAENITFPAVTDPTTLGVVKIQHFLGVMPKWRIILRQTGNGVITDITGEWNNKTISLKNNGTEQVIASILIARE
jgi:hypothetical protein